MIPPDLDLAMRRELAATGSTAIVLSPDDDAPPLGSKKTKKGKRWLTKAQRRKLTRVLRAAPELHETTQVQLPPRAVRRQQMAEHGAPALGLGRREAWKLYQLTKGP